jgi:hypothetical protein
MEYPIFKKEFPATTANRQLIAYNPDFAQEIRANFTLCAANGLKQGNSPTLAFDKAFLKANMEQGSNNAIAREMAYIIALQAGGGETVTDSEGREIQRNNHFATADTLRSYVLANYQSFAAGWMLTYDKLTEQFTPQPIVLSL